MIMAAPFPNGWPQLEHSFFPLTDLQEGHRETEHLYDCYLCKLAVMSLINHVTSTIEGTDFCLRVALLQCYMS